MKKTLFILLLAFLLFSVFTQVVYADCICHCNNGFIDAMSTIDCTGMICEPPCIGACQAVGSTFNPNFDTCSSYTPPVNPNPANPANPVSTSQGTNQTAEIKDPLKLEGGPEKLYARIITALLSFVGIASLVAFVYAGFIFLISAGNPERVKKAKDTMLYAVIGIFVAMASYAILSFIFTTLEGTIGQ